MRERVGAVERQRSARVGVRVRGVAEVKGGELAVEGIDVHHARLRPRSARNLAASVVVWHLLHLGIRSQQLHLIVEDGDVLALPLHPSFQSLKMKRRLLRGAHEEGVVQGDGAGSLALRAKLNPSLEFSCQLFRHPPRVPLLKQGRR